MYILGLQKQNIVPISDSGRKVNNSYLTASVALIGEGFNIPEGHPVRYIAKDWAGDEEKRGVELTKFDGNTQI